ncbi:MAG: hypothetical protein IJD78_03905 [Clostridia bacterium]|nr:hypothetical protein [Clostridia bacterium]
MKRIVSLLLCVVILFTVVVSAAPVSVAAEDAAVIPVVHVVGTGTPISRKNAEGETERVYPVQIPDGYIEEKAKIFLPVFAEAFFTQRWDEFCDVLYEILSPLFSSMALDKNGEVTDGSYVEWTWSLESLAADTRADGTYGVTDYMFHYDWRLDPMIIADTLHRYIEDVLTVTGAEKVALYGRCLGSNIVAAYMHKYGGEHVCEVIHYASALYGATQCSKVFTGELRLHADGIERFVYDINLDIDEYFMGFIQAFVSLLNKTYGLDITCWAINNVMEDIYLDIIPRVIAESYGTFPAYWGMVRIEDYEKAMETVFYGSDISEYSKLIEKIEYFRNNVQLTFEDDVKKHRESGIEFSNIVKYGYQSIPVTEEGDALSDALCSVEKSSFGAATALVNESFSDDYIEKAKEKGTFNYISPDKQIDASTCLSPDTTWFVKNLFHTDFPTCINGLVSEIVNNDGYTVISSAEYPQYLVYNKEDNQLVPMDSGNMNTTQRWEVTFFEAFVSFFKNLLKMIEGKVAESFAK